MWREAVRPALMAGVRLQILSAAVNQRNIAFPCDFPAGTSPYPLLSTGRPFVNLVRAPRPRTWLALISVLTGMATHCAGSGWGVAADICATARRVLSPGAVFPPERVDQPQEMGCVVQDFAVCAWVVVLDAEEGAN